MQKVVAAGLAEMTAEPGTENLILATVAAEDLVELAGMTKVVVLALHLEQQG